MILWIRIQESHLSIRIQVGHLWIRIQKVHTWIRIQEGHDGPQIGKMITFQVIEELYLLPEVWGFLLNVKVLRRSK
jgi:hypothetical protein